jgi:hypothetical protein
VNYLVIVGNPLDGYTHFGPFDSQNEATDWASENVDRYYEWWIGELFESVEEMEKME